MDNIGTEIQTGSQSKQRESRSRKKNSCEVKDNRRSSKHSRNRHGTQPRRSRASSTSKDRRDRSGRRSREQPGADHRRRRSRSSHGSRIRPRSRVRSLRSRSSRDSSGSSRSRGSSRRRSRDSSHRHCRGRARDRSRGRARDRSRGRGRRRSHSRSRRSPCGRNKRLGSQASKQQKRQRRSSTSSRADHVSTFDNIDENNSFISKLIKTLTNNRQEGNKFPMLGNVIPDFDPMIKGQTIHMWLNKVAECARLYKWGDDQIIHYGLPKLTGVAKTWYQALPSMSFSWPEWKNKLIESFPSSDDYAELLMEMMSKRVKYNDSLELYFYEKINLLNRCEITGKRAVDCLLYGIDDRSVRLGAKASKCQEPEQVLEYFQSVKQQNRDSDRFKSTQDKRPILNRRYTSD